MSDDWTSIAVQGAISGAVVVLGIVVAAAIDRARTRRRAVEVAYHALETPLTATTSGLIDPEIDRSLRSPWKEQFDQAHSLLMEIHLQSRNFRGAKSVRQATRELSAQILVANILVNIHGERISPMFSTEATGIDLKHATFGEGDPVPDEIFDATRDQIRSIPFPDHLR